MKKTGILFPTFHIDEPTLSSSSTNFFTRI